MIGSAARHRIKRSLAPVPAGGAVGLAILAVGGASHAGVIVLAAIGAVAFGDLARRAVTERIDGPKDPTDLWMSVAFAVILVGGAWDLGGGAMTAWPPWLAVTARIVGLALIAVGLVLRQLAARALGENFLVRLGIREGHTLVQSGPYRRIRHPTYTGLLAVAIGTSTALGSPSAIVATVALWLPLVFARMAREERVLVGRFGREYCEYMDRTWRLVPGIV
ncbi:MAG: methyltransferase family protein [Candidatus Binatia bacterium]